MKHDKNDLLRRQDCIEAIEGITCSMSLCVNADECHGMQRMRKQAVIELANMPAVQPEHNADISEINKFIDGLEEILADIRERHVDDSVCGLCEYDGAYMGQSGDWCNECPGFDKDDCFKLSDETRKKWIEEIVNTYPDHNADISKKAEGDCISRQAAIDAVNNAFDRETLLTGFVRSIAVRVIRDMPSTQPEPSEITDEQAILHLQSTGWMQNHDREIYESGLKEQLADDSESYDSLIPYENAISRQAAIDLFPDDDLEYDTKGGYIAPHLARQMICELPSAQPEIIRCKDCKHRDPEDKKCDCGHDIRWQLPRHDDWHCADAERRTDAAD